MFRYLTMVIFRLYTKYLLSSYTKRIWAVYMGRAGEEVGTRCAGGEVGTRSRIYHRGWEVWVLGGT